MRYDKTCIIYPFVTTTADEQEMEGFSATPSYSWACDYWERTGTFINDVVVQDNKSRKKVDLPWIQDISVLSKVVLDNGETFKIVKVEKLTTPNKYATNTLLYCEYTDG